MLRGSSTPSWIRSYGCSKVPSWSGSGALSPSTKVMLLATVTFRSFLDDDVSVVTSRFSSTSTSSEISVRTCRSRMTISVRREAKGGSFFDDWKPVVSKGFLPFEIFSIENGATTRAPT